MSCDERRDLLLLRALGALEPAEEAELARLLAQECPPLAEVQAEVEATLAQLALGLPPTAPSPDARAAFMARLAAQPRGAGQRRDEAAVSGVPSTAPAAAAPASSQPPARVAGAAPQPRASAPAPRRGTRLAAGLGAAAAGALLALLLAWWPAQRQAAAATLRAQSAEQALAKADVEMLRIQQTADQRADQLQQQLAQAANALRDSKDAAAQASAELQQRLAKAGAELQDMQRAVDAKVAGLTAQLAEVDRLLGTARQEIARRDRDLDALGKQAKEFTAWAAGAKDQLVKLQDERAMLARRLDQAEATVGALRSPQVKLVELAGAGPQPKAAARIVWDQQRNVWHLVATNLAPPAAGRTYELWFITDKQQKIAAGTFDVDANGDGDLSVAIPPNLGTLALAAVTDEPHGGVAVPTGSIHLVGKL